MRGRARPGELIKTVRSVFLFFGLFPAFFVGELEGQTYQGSVRGTIRDAGGGVLPGVTVKLLEEATGIARTPVSNEVGEYVFGSVSPGKYTLRAELQGFKPYAHSGIEVGVQRFVVLDVLLEVGPVTESITVTGESPLLERATASWSSSLESVELQTLPTAFRNPFYLSTTTPNVVPSGIAQFNRMQDQSNASFLSIAGGPRRGNNYTLDGVPITDLVNRAVIIPSVEAVEEVKIQVSTYDAEMGRTGGGVFNTVHKSGGNDWRGSVLVQNRPEWGVGRLYFAEQADEPNPDSYYWLYAGSFGGPISRDKTFFWASTEGYRTSTAANSILVLPTAAEARGDFSQSGRILYDPLSTRPDPANPGHYIRDPFPGNAIPAERLNPIGLRLAALLAQRGTGEVSATANAVDSADQFSLNLRHRFSEENQLSATYMYYDSEEPAPLFYGGASDPGNFLLFRQVHALALNETLLPTEDTVVTLRYGYTSFVNDFQVPEFDPGELGFSQNFLSQIDARVFPEICVDGYGAPDWCTHGGWATSDTTFYSHAANGTVSRFFGNHAVKMGGDFRRLGRNAFAFGPRAGSFFFDSSFTGGPDPTNPDPDSGDALASLLLGFPAGGNIFSATTIDQFLHYYGGFVQDDWRISPSLVLNLGLRVEHETGLREKNNRQTVGFDRESPWPLQPIEGMTLQGGLMYAGVDGYPEQQGDPTAVKWGPRIGGSWTLTPSSVVRGGYGVFWVPYQPTNETRRGYETFTNYFASNDGGLTPAGTLTDPFPNGIEQPAGSSLGLLTGAGGDVDFPDQFRESAYVQQYSVEIQRELPGALVLSAGYLGSRSERLGFGGAESSAPVNINQLDPSYLELGSSLLDPVPNPFFGNPIFGDLSQSPTVPRSQLLRPYPQFGNLYARQVSAGKRRYDSLVLRADRRFRSGFGGRINYTWSRTDDNIVGEDNAFSQRRPFALNNYDLDSEYSPSITDTPHRLNLSGIFELPFGRGKRWLDEGGVLDALFGDWTFSAAGYYQSGFPIAVFQRNNTGLGGDLQRPNVVPGVDPGHAGSTEENLGSYLNPEAWSSAPAFTFGNAPRTDTRVRTPSRQNWDFSFQKSPRVGAGTLTVRVEIINAFDHPDFGGPVTNFESPNFGKILGVSGFPRLFQFTLRYAW